MTTTPTWLLVVANYFERLFWTFVQTYIAYGLAQETLDLTFSEAAAMAGAAACLTVLLGTLTDWAFPTNLPFAVLGMLRVIRTLAVSTLTILLTAPVLDLSVDGWKVALIGSLPAVFTAIKVLAAERIGASTPATLPAKVDALAPANVSPDLVFAA